MPGFASAYDQYKERENGTDYTALHSNDDYFYYNDGTGYPYDEFEYDEDYDDYDDYDENDCAFCDIKGCLLPASDMCQCCGKWLCHMHHETGCGFCSECPTKEWIDEQKEKSI